MIRVIQFHKVNYQSVRDTDQIKPDLWIVVQERGLNGRFFAPIFENIDNNWNYLAKVLKLIPINILDTAYRWVSRNRAKISVKKVSSCPIVPSYYQKRFIL